jgi:lipopolysaccharide export system protein LptC
MKGLPAIWFGLMLLALLTALTFWIDKIAEPPAPKRDGSTRHDPDYIVKNFSTLRTNGFGNPRYKLEGAEMRHYPDDDSTDLVKPRFSLYALKKPTTEIIGDWGRVSANGENIYFMDNVKVVRAATPRKAKMTVLTDYLHIVPNQDFAQTDRPVTILQEPRTVIKAVGMQFYKKQGIVKLNSKVKVHYERPDAAFTKALSLEQVAGTAPRLLPGKSVVRPQMDSLMPESPVALPLKASTPEIKEQSLAPVNKVDKVKAKQAKSEKAKTKKAEKAKKAKKAKSEKAKKAKSKKTKQNETQKTEAENSKTRIRRQYENP